MKLLTLNFLTCATKPCKAQVSVTTTIDTQQTTDAGQNDASSSSPFPLHVREAELERVELEFNPLFLRNILTRIEWPAMEQVVAEVGLKLPPQQQQSMTKRGETATGDAVTSQGEGGDAMAVDNLEDDDGNTRTDTEKREEQNDDNDDEHFDEEYLQKIHSILMETTIQSGKLVCGRCGHEYAIREGIANFLLPPHLV